MIDFWIALRDRTIANPRFQRWAARFPPTRALARRRASALFDLTAGFVYSQVLVAVVRLRILETVGFEPKTLDEIRATTDLTREATERLVHAAVALGLLELRGRDRYGLGPQGSSLIGHEGVKRMIEHHALLYRDLSDPLSLLRGELQPELARFWSYAGDGDSAAYSALMTSSMELLAEDVFAAFPLDRFRHLLDIGGGEGAFVSAAAARFPKLTVTLFDLPPVAARAEARVKYEPRIRVVGGDVFVDAPPRGADLVSLVRVIHDHDDARALEILRAARNALGPRGTVIVAEPMAATRGAERMGDAYFGFYLLAMRQGRPRTEATLRALLQTAGFRNVRRRTTSRTLFVQVLTAECQ